MIKKIKIYSDIEAIPLYFIRKDFQDEIENLEQDKYTVVESIYLDYDGVEIVKNNGENKGSETIFYPFESIHKFEYSKIEEGTRFT